MAWILLPFPSVLNLSISKIRISCLGHRHMKTASLQQESRLYAFNLKTILPGSRPTFHHNNGSSESQIDHILVNNLDLVAFYEQKCKYTDHENLSGHDALIGSLKTISQGKNDANNMSYEDFLLSKIIWENNPCYEEQVSDMINHL